MKSRTATLPINEPGNLLKAPHVLSQLIDLFNSKSQPSTAQQKQIGQHLANCLHCQVFVEIALVYLIEDEQARGKSAVSTQMLLHSLSRITHATIAKDLLAYTEMLAEQGEAAAKQRCPLFAEHLHTCQNCQSEVEGLRSWLEALG